MDLKAILDGVENNNELIKQIEQELGQDYVPRSEFNAKNDALKESEKQLNDLNSTIDELTQSKSTNSAEIDELKSEISTHKLLALKNSIAREYGIPYELSGRLAGDDEDSLRGDAQTLADLIKRDVPPPPLRDTETQGNDNAAYKALLSNIKGDE